ncbi:hypothetical protein CAPTEDRAFT_188656 [Capitella teleta]|uniref:G-protein coupled receptors family 1 profile domain-containing protein n=1 Tax=Capitella teleta TaxID=283909 RepID=R7V004_CAPTE|nr:hypothetical protein CAPTEDRAFT_188656 [Capitella teleta]|eukprot:ELU11847.1 hypothetical protein CAPTEDRAFT_188656 [Capitella teleta]
METVTELATAVDVPVGDSAVQIVLITAGCVVSVFGVLTNLLLLLTYIKHPELQNPANLLLVNQSIADLITCGLAPIYYFLSHTEVGKELTSKYKYLCLVTLCAIVLTLWASLFSLLSLSFERMMNIRFPFHYVRLVTEPLVKRFSIALWIAMVAIVSLPLFGLNTWQPGQTCSALTTFPKIYFINFFLLTSFIIVILVGVLNLVICAVAISKRKIHPSGTETEQLQMKSQYKLTKMFLVVVGVFYFCWMPYIILNMIALLGVKTLLGGHTPVTTHSEAINIHRDLSATIVMCLDFFPRRTYGFPRSRVITSVLDNGVEVKQLYHFEPTNASIMTISETLFSDWYKVWYPCSALKEASVRPVNQTTDLSPTCVDYWFTPCYHLAEP